MSERPFTPDPKLGAPIPVVVDERLQGATPEEQARILREYLRTGGTPQGPVYARPTEAPTAPAPGDGFTAEDLLTPLEYRAEPYVMPNGKRLWVHPVAVEEAGWLNRQAVREVQGLNLLRPDGTLEPGAQVELVNRARVWQCICACRTGPAPDAPKVFRSEHARALRVNPGYLKAVEEIAALSDSLNAGQSEAALYRQAVTDFFGVMTSWLGTWCSALNTDSWPTARQALGDFVHSVASLRQQGPLSGSELVALAHCFIAPSVALEFPVPVPEPA